MRCAAAPSEAPARSRLGEACREDFPVLHQLAHGKPLVYLDNAATSQKPEAVLGALRGYYAEDNANVHRGVHYLAAKATTSYEAARGKVAAFVGAKSDREIVFARNATEALNLVAYSWGLENLGEGDEVVLSVLEHHANIVPWQLVAARTGAVLKFVGLTEDERYDVDGLRGLVGPRTKLIATAHVSNTLGCEAPVADIAQIARECGALFLLDACQSVPHMPVDVGALGCDFLVASSHKMCGPTGIGFLWARPEVLEAMPPWMGGGEMIQDVYLDHSTYAPPPMRFEAGTPAIGEAVGLGAACDYLTGLGMEEVHAFEREIGGYLYERLSAVDGVRVYGPKPEQGRASLCAFNCEGLHANDISTLLDQAGVAVRSGHHCTQPLHRHLGIPASARASAYVYNTEHEVDVFVEALKDTVGFFKEMGVC